jgi:hypothetical protein
MASKGLSPDFVRNMTLEELAALPQNTVGTNVAAHFLEMDRFNVTLMARQNILPPEIKCHFSGNRLHIMKWSLLDYLGYQKHTA